MSEPKEPTVGEMVDWIKKIIKIQHEDHVAYYRDGGFNPERYVYYHDYIVLQAIRKHLEPVTVSRERVERYVRVLSVARGYIRTRMHIIDLLTELGIEVSKEVEP